MYDAIVVGARCAGSPLAMLLARRGWSVLLVDKNTFSSDTMSTHFVHPSGIARLKRWGLLDEIAASGCPPITRSLVSVGNVTLQGSPPPIDGVAEAYCPRRTVLDHVLVRAARQAGAEVREAFTVPDLVKDADQVVGIRGETRGGASVIERGRIVIGADGLRSMVAKSVAAPVYGERPILCCAHYTYWADVSLAVAEFHLRNERAVFAIPTNDGQVCTFVEWPKNQTEAFRKDVEGNFLGTIDLVPSLAERVRRGRRTRHFVGTAELPNFFRKPYGPGWALAGDAGHHKDPCGGYGISDAFRDAEALAVAIDAVLSGQQRFDAALAAYERARNEAAMPSYDFNCQMASLQPERPRPARGVLAAAVEVEQAGGRPARIRGRACQGAESPSRRGGGCRGCPAGDGWPQGHSLTKGLFPSAAHMPHMLTNNASFRARRANRIGGRIVRTVATIPAELGRALTAGWSYERLRYGRAREENLAPADIPGRIFEEFYAAKRTVSR